MQHDLLSDVLRHVRLRGALYFHVSAGRDWVAEAPPSREIVAAVLPGSQHMIEFHAILSGACWGARVGSEPVRLAAGDVILFPQGDAHVVSSAPGMRAPPDAAGYFARRARPLPFVLHLDVHETRVDGVPPGGSDTTLVCGFVGCDLRPFNPLIGSLPPLMHLPAGPGLAWTVGCMRQAAAEASALRAGSGAMLERLSEMLFIDAVRQYLDTLPEASTGWLAGLRDRFVGRALALMHAEPAEPWTVEALGRRVGLSRSGFHAHFAHLIGHAPMQYLAQWRMQVAAARLRDSTATVAAVAQEVGYESEASFSRAFKRAVGQPPSAWRRDQAVTDSSPAVDTAAGAGVRIR